MPDPFSFTDPMLTKPFLGGVDGISAPITPSGLPQRSAAGTMIAPITPRPTVPQPAPAPAAPQPVQQPAHPQSPGNVDQFMHLVRAHESGGNDKASSGVADGRYQFTPQTWAGVSRQHPELGLQPNDIWDGGKQDLAMRAISQDYVNTLKTNGIAPTMPNMFMLHFLGTGGGPKFLKEMAANPNANAAALFPLEAKYNPTIFQEKGGQPRSLQQVYALMTKTFGGPQSQPIDAKMAPVNPEELKAIDSFSGVSSANEQMLANSGVTASLEEIPGGLKPLPGMTPIKTELKPLPGMTPLKLDYNSAEPLKSAAGYTDSTGAYHPSIEASKPDAPAPEVMGVDPTTGTPIFADPKLNTEVAKGEAEMGKGFAAGVAQDVTGPASLLPNSLGGGYAEKANDYLSKTGDPMGRTLGNLAPMALPVGEVLGAVKAGSKAAEAGESLWPAVRQGAVGGGVTGALSESSNPTGKEDYGERLAAKAPRMAEAGGIGALGGGIVPAVGSVAQRVIGEISDVFGWKVGKAAEELRTGFDAATGKELTKEQQAEHVATIKQAAEEKVIADQAQRKTAPPEVVGKELHAVLTEDRDIVMEKRRAASGFKEAVKSDGGLPKINTKGTTNEIAEIEKKFDINLSDLKSKLATKPDVRGGPTVRGVSIERGRDFVEVLNNKIEESTSGPAHALMAVRDKFIEHMVTTHPQLKAAREKYAELSRDVDVYERKGKLAKAAESDLYSKQPVMDSTKVTSLLTDKTEAGGAAIKRLVERDKTGKVQDSIRQHFNHELFGSAGATKTPTVAQMTKLLETRRVALENSGLYKEFEQLRNERAAFEDPAKVREAAVKSQHEINTIRSDLTGARKPRDVVAASRKALTMLNRYPPRIPLDEYEKLRRGVEDVEEHIEDHARARKFALIMGGILASAVGGEEVARYVGHKYTPR